MSADAKDAIRPMAARVADDHEVHEAQRFSRREAAALVLRDVVESLHRALPALVTRHGVREIGLCIWHGEERTFYLGTDGLYRVEKRGGGERVATTPAEAVQLGVSVAGVVERVFAALEAQVAGGKGKATLEISREAARFRRAAAVLRGEE